MNDPSSPAILYDLAVFSAETTFVLSDTATGCVRAALIDALGCVLAGSREPVARRTRDALAGWGGGQAVVFATGLALPAPFAALANATAAHALDFDDWEIPGNSHVSAVIVPALLAAASDLGDTRPVTGQNMLEAYVAGFEVTARLGEALNFDHYAKGWHSTSSLGVIGAAAAVARLMGLDATTTLHALSLAFSQASGFTCQFGSDAKPLQAGFAARDGLLAAKLAAEGLAGQAHILDASNGFAALTAHGDLDRIQQIRDRLSGPLAIEQYGIVFKPYPSCGYTHRLLDCALSLRENVDFSLERIVAVEGSLQEFHAAILPFHQPSSRAEAMFSAPFCIAVGLVRGGLGLEDFDPKMWDDPVIRKLMAATRISVRTPPGGGPDGNADDADWLELTLDNGIKLRAEAAYPQGHPQNPLSAEQLRAKFDANFTRGMGCHVSFRANAVDALMAWDETPDLLALVEEFGSAHEASPGPIDRGMLSDPGSTARDNGEADVAARG